MIQPLLREVYGRLLRRLRQSQGRTLAEVAAEAGVSMAYLSEIERGLKEPSSEILAAVCGALDATIVGLVGAAHQELRDLAAEASAEARVLDLASRRGVHARQLGQAEQLEDAGWLGPVGPVAPVGPSTSRGVSLLAA